MYICQSQHPNFSHPSFTMSLLYVCISIPVHKIGKSVPLFQIQHKSINIGYFFFFLSLSLSFCLTSLWVIDARPIHISKLPSSIPFLWLTSIPLHICTTSSFKNKDHGIQSHHFMANKWRIKGNSARFYLLGPQNHCGQ